MGQTWSANPIQGAANIGSDVVGFFAGPSGDPGRIRQAANQIESIRDHFDGDRTALNAAVDELTRTWTGDAAHAVADGWHTGAGKTSSAMALADASQKLGKFAGQLRDYADQLEHAQHEHWIQMAMLAAMTVVNAAQLGMDPATDAVEVGEVAATAVGSSFALADLSTFAVEGAFVGFASDVVSQLGTDGWDHLDGAFDQTHHHAVGLFDSREALLSSASGGATGTLLATGGRLFGNFLMRDSRPLDSEFESPRQPRSSAADAALERLDTVARCPSSHALNSLGAAARNSSEFFPGLSTNELDTLRRLGSHPDFAGHVFTESPHVGAEVVDESGRTYDFLGHPRASRHWSRDEFTASIDAHLLKANDFTVIHLTGFAPEQLAEVRAYIDALPDQARASIITLGF